MPEVSIPHAASYAGLAFTCGLLIGSAGWLGLMLSVVLLVAFLVAEDMVLGRHA